MITVIPCYNEDRTINSIVSLARQYSTVIVSDDNSTDYTIDRAEKAGAVIVFNFTDKRGAGLATSRGIDWAKKMSNENIIVTLDGDGQHYPENIPIVVKPIEEGQADLVIGSRFLKDYKYKVPKYRKLGIDIITWLYNVGHKKKITDAQSCFRAYSREVITNVDITEPKFAFSVEILIKARAKGYKITEVPIECIYHNDFKMNSSLNPIIHGLSVALATIKWRLKLELIPWIRQIAFVTFKFIARRLVGHGLGGIKPLAQLYVILCSMLIPQDSTTVEINDCLMHVDKRKIDGISQKIYFEGSFEPNTTKIFKHFIKEGNSVIDVGANIGYYTLLSGKLVGNEGKVWAFEPEPVNITDLEKNIELNKLSNIEVVPKAASNKNGTAIMYLADMESGAHSLARIPPRSNKTMEIETVKIDDIVNSHKVDFMKSDAEGHDTSVLLGAERVLQENEDIKLVVEFLLPGVDSPEYTCEEFWDLLENHFGFKHIYIIDEIQNFIKKGDLEFAKKCYSKYKLSVNLLCSRKEVNLDGVT